MRSELSFCRLEYNPGLCNSGQGQVLNKSLNEGRTVQAQEVRRRSDPHLQEAGHRIVGRATQYRLNFCEPRYPQIHEAFSCQRLKERSA